MTAEEDSEKASSGRDAAPSLPSLQKIGGTVTGRVKARWGFLAAYQSATPTAVSWPGGKLESASPQINSRFGPLRNTAVHANRLTQAIPAIQYQDHTRQGITYKTTIDS